MRFVLASKSPRRKEILEKIGLKFETLPADVDENIESGTSPDVAVTVISERKAKAVLEKVDENVFVLSADTVVSIDGKILGKPKNKMDAMRMLNLLSGRTHTVYTGFTLATHEKTVKGYESTLVKFKELSRKEIEIYVDCGEPMDKAGAYGIQEKGAVFVEGINGDYFNVMGLPVCRICKCAKEEFGIELQICKAVMFE